MNTFGRQFIATGLAIALNSCGKQYESPKSPEDNTAAKDVSKPNLNNCLKLNYLEKSIRNTPELQSIEVWQEKDYYRDDKGAGPILVKYNGTWRSFPNDTPIENIIKGLTTK